MSGCKGVKRMQYISTRGHSRPLGFADTLLTGLAPDGGLYLPNEWPRLTRETLEKLQGSDYGEIVLETLLPFVGEDFSRDELTRLIQDAYAQFRHPAICPLIQLAPHLHLLELFHGPTLAFKDFALQLVGRMFAHILEQRGRRVTIVGATSGDTGSAAIEAFRGLDSADIFILYPFGRVSEIQRRQMTVPDDENVHAIAVDGDFDACQALVKAMFNDEDFRHQYQLGAVNSINWARIVAQAAYYIAAGVTLGSPDRQVSFVVPTGNFGDIFAGYTAKRMGLPIDRLVVATNQNDILHRFLSSGHARINAVLPSISPSMDIQVSSNFERALFEASDRDAGCLRALMEQAQTGEMMIPGSTLHQLQEVYASGRASEQQTQDCMAVVLKETEQLVCPHSAVGIHVARSLRNETSSPLISLATAHPAKFPDAVQAATGMIPALPTDMQDLFDRKERIMRAPDDLRAVQSIIRERCDR